MKYKDKKRYHEDLVIRPDGIHAYLESDNSPIDGIVQYYDKKADGSYYLSCDKEFKKSEPTGWVTYYDEDGKIESRSMYFGDYPSFTIRYTNGVPNNAKDVTSRLTYKEFRDECGFDDFYELD